MERAGVDDDDAEDFALALCLEEDAFDEGRAGVGEDRVAVVDLGDGVLLDDFAGEEDAVADERVDLVDQERLGLRGRREGASVPWGDLLGDE